ncbi:MAG: hypothetical protein L6R40_005934 [Gallowayella cf. fulva]|nr:MAG: hypothetical protein L6R40_005934 [Xanthomendoza cf. fulva]
MTICLVGVDRWDELLQLSLTLLNSGAMVVAHALRDNATKNQLAVLVTMNTLQVSTLDELRKVYDFLIPVDAIVNKSPANLYLMHRPDLISTFTKIQLWRQTQFRKIVYLDADTVALRAPDELFAEKSSFAAVPDIGWPDCFNSGVLVLSPNMGDYYALLALAKRGISFDGADQGLLNMHFQDWHRLSFSYNCTPSGNYQYVPAYRHFQSRISMVHFIGTNKPWIVGRDWKGATGVYEELLGRWTVQKYVRGETVTSEFGSSFIPGSSIEAPFTTTEIPLTEMAELSRGVEHRDVKSVPTGQQRNFSIEWDPMHHPPPSDSRPEAENFTKPTYSISTDPRNFYQPPLRYPDPPKNVSYPVPPTPPTSERPKRIFPWEEHQTKANRVFAEDRPRGSSSGSAPSITTDAGSPAGSASPSTPTIQVTPPQTFADQLFTNAWDEMPAIQRYVESLPLYHRRRRLRTYHHKGTQSPDYSSLTSSPSIEDAASSSQGSRRSLRLTNFPTEIEQPSLPATPGSIRRPSFWGQERDAAGDLPSAEGVPDQVDWDPVAKLDELQRRQIELLKAGPLSPRRDIPIRALPPSSQPFPNELSEKKSTLETVSPPAVTTPSCGESDAESVSPEAEVEKEAKKASEVSSE